MSSGRRGGGARYAHVVNCIQLSRPGSTACGITEGGTTQTHSVGGHAGSSERKHRTHRRSLVGICKGEDSSKPPQKRVLRDCTHAAEPAPTRSIRSKRPGGRTFGGNRCQGAPHTYKVQWRPLLYVWRVSAVTKASSNVTKPPTRRGRVRTTRGQGRRQNLSPTPQRFGRPARPGNSSKPLKEEPCQRWSLLAEQVAAIQKSRESSCSWSEYGIDEKKEGGPTRPHFRLLSREQQKSPHRASFTLSTSGGH